MVPSICAVSPVTRPLAAETVAEKAVAPATKTAFHPAAAVPAAAVPAAADEATDDKALALDMAVANEEVVPAAAAAVEAVAT